MTEQWVLPSEDAQSGDKEVEDFIYWADRHHMEFTQHEAIGTIEIVNEDGTKIYAAPGDTIIHDGGQFSVEETGPHH